MDGPAPEASFTLPFSDDLVLLTETEQSRAIELADDLGAGEIPHHLRPKCGRYPALSRLRTRSDSDLVRLRPAGDLERAQAYIEASDSPLAMSPEEIEAAIRGDSMDDTLGAIGALLRWVGAAAFSAGALSILIAFAWPEVAFFQSRDALVYAYLLAGGGSMAGFLGMAMKEPALLPDAEAPEDGA